MDRDAIRKFAYRDWAAVAAAKRERSARAYAERGDAWSAALADDLYAHVKERRPEWPSAADRDADLAAHVALQALFAKVARGRRGA
jgi:hypothetical protein